jgi:hypothetical protein
VLVKGHVPTPDGLADEMVRHLFAGNQPYREDEILYPGIGTGPFVSAVHRYCLDHNYSIPDGVGIESDPELVSECRERHENSHVEIQHRDFLEDVSDLGRFEYVIGNPPYVSIKELSKEEKGRYRDRFETATGRFDLYTLFFEQALNSLLMGGHLVFVTPEKFEYTEATQPLRRLLMEHHVELIEHVAEDSFGELTTYPAITKVRGLRSDDSTIIRRRDWSENEVRLPKDGSSWASVIRGDEACIESSVTLGDICQRVSCGVATGADGVFVQKRAEVPAPLIDEWTYPTTSGKQLRLNDGPNSGSVFISPYREDGTLPSEGELGTYGMWAEMHRDKLEERFCVREAGQPWYSWHENPPMKDLFRSKILCKDVTKEPKFWADRAGDIVPRHSVYYIVPDSGVEFDELLAYLNSSEAKAWLEANCQHAANGFLRLQSRVLERLPVPERLAEEYQETLSRRD